MTIQKVKQCKHNTTHQPQNTRTASRLVQYQVRNNQITCWLQLLSPSVELSVAIMPKFHTCILALLNEHSTAVNLQYDDNHPTF